MKKTKLARTFIGLFLSIGFISCSSDDDEMSTIQPSTNLIEMEAEGGETVISFTSGQWDIAEVINQNGDVNIHGDIYSHDGEIIKKNSILSLKDQGKIEALWKNKGFIITRDIPSSLEIWLKENSTGEKFGFTVVLKSGEEVKEIKVIQKKSQGYQFDSMEFSLKKEDGDSLFVKKGTTFNFNFNVPESRKFTFSPYGGIDVHNQSNFVSSENDAFVWIENDSIMVEVPTDIYDNEIYFSGEQRLYSKYSSKKPHGFEEMETVSVPSGQSSFFTKQEWRRRQVSFKLSLTNNRTGEEKIIEGKWYEIAPTGEYSIEWQD
ncbi:hypothetical protein [Gelidibacter salicanalis]|uniref:Uncharacterized protein n=1 Tax=Gelidibacter salicanalis TaxID=291193 RepID=A0A934KYH2_9FLAO|nr:hypothetical protein [Gelidibacter salicanalis]MBJ7881635.1 hypothetical protein [Gelidibacter salicanalis]